MSEHIFRTYFFGSLAQKYLRDFAVWARRFMVVGVLLQLLFLGFAGMHIHEYFSYARKYPATAESRLISGLFEAALGLISLYLYSLFNRSAKAFARAASDEGTDLDLEQAFSMNLRLIKYQFYIIGASVLYYSYLLFKYAISTAA